MGKPETPILYDVIYFWKGDDKRILNMICGRQDLRKYKYRQKHKYKDKYKNCRLPMMLYVFGKEMTMGVWLWRICRICRICKIFKICRICTTCTTCRICKMWKIGIKCKTCKIFLSQNNPNFHSSKIALLFLVRFSSHKSWSPKSNVPVQYRGPV